MFKMILLHSVLLFLVINVSLQHAVTADEIQSLIDQINLLNTKYAEQNVKIAEQNVKIAEQNIKLAEQEEESSRQKSIGSIFTRWGHSECPSNISQLVYSGITGGSLYTDSGAAAEYVCLPPDPTWDVYENFNVGSYFGYMYGTEYEQLPMSYPKNFKVPCAVCRTSQFSTVLMIPGRAECYQGWQIAYYGELASGLNTHIAATQYVCLDRFPQAKAPNTNFNGKLMYPVRAKCGALPCPPYKADSLLTCVVCLK